MAVGCWLLAFGGWLYEQLIAKSQQPGKLLNAAPLIFEQQVYSLFFIRNEIIFPSAFSKHLLFAPAISHSFSTPGKINSTEMQASHFGHIPSLRSSSKSGLYQLAVGALAVGTRNL
ncbi:hypothetical protein [Endozoicomonas euniceicola]|uniref:Uncharacterized protein n=1 Tax=Endozoicomonas euniceicola TaxID=1234143 RepID=A0ABY6GMD9_9GAMM|nr:hypothetical protein [Endozoicomonas euniceicola]UYM13842.1 hypothetical protein NX720_13005 [Endozoicomonas euniceicola]